MPLRLGLLVSLPLAERADYILRFGLDDLQFTVSALAAAGSPCGKAITSQRVAWAMAFNLRPPDDPEGTSADTISLRFARGRNRAGGLTAWSAATSWEDVWAAYTTPHAISIFDADGNTPAARTLLRELARSVACEQRQDWPWSSTPPDADLAKLCTEEAVSLATPKVHGIVARYTASAFAQEEIVSATWERALQSAWGPSADNRFVGRSLISSWLCAIALNVARNYGRAEARRRRRQEVWTPGREASVAPEVEVFRAPEPGESGGNPEQLAQRFRACVQSLGVDDQELFGLLLRGVSPSEIARARGTTPPTVSQHQERLVRNLRRCFADRQVRTGTKKQQVFKGLRDLLASIGPEGFSFLKRPPADRQP